MTGPVVRFRRVSGDAGPAGPTGAGQLAGWERERAERLRDPRDRAAFVQAHLLVRDCVEALTGERLGIVQRCPSCGREGHGAPSVPARPDVRVSLSHTRGWVAAIAATTACGIDVQAVGHVPDRALTARERAASPDARARTRLWARKEALVKAGAAAVDRFGSLDVLDPDPRLHDWESGDVVGAWTLRSP